MEKKKLIISLSFVFVLAILIVSIISNTYAIPSNLYNTNSNGGIQFLGDDGTIYPNMTCTLTYTGCDASTMQTSCNSVGGTLSGNVCTWEMVDNGENRCGASTKVCETEVVEEQCYYCKTEDWIYHWGTSMPASGTNGCSGGWGKSALTELGCVSGNPPAEEEEPTYNQYCYTCSTDNNIFRRYEWEYNAPSEGTDNCSGWTIDYTLGSLNCNDESKQCYVCDSDNEYYWGYNKPNDGSNNCSGSWTLDSSITEENCVAKVPEPEPEEPSCYICSTDKNKFYWGLEQPSSGTNECSGNWQEDETISRNDCVSIIKEPDIINPDTGSWLLYVVYLTGILSVGYGIYYAFKVIKSR